MVGEQIPPQCFAPCRNDKMVRVRERSSAIFRGQRPAAFGEDGPGFLVGLVFVAILFERLHGEEHEAGFARGAENDGGGDEIPDILRNYPSTPNEVRFAYFIFRSGQAPAAKMSICWRV